MAQRILIAWEDERARTELAGQLEARGYTVLGLHPHAEWLGDLLRSSVDVLIVAPGPEQERILRLLERMEEPRTTVVARTPDDLASQSTQPTLLDEIERALTQRRLRLEIQALRSLVADRVWNGVLAGTSAAVTRLRRDLEALESSTSPVLLVGPSGSGRRYVAQAIHLLSARAGGPFHEIDCEIQPHERSASLLFGRLDEPGKRRPGWIERTHGGSLALLGVGRLSFSTQVLVADYLRTGMVAPIAPPAGDARPTESARSTGDAPSAEHARWPGQVPAKRGRPIPPPQVAIQADVRLFATLTRDPEVEIAQGWLAPAFHGAMQGLLVRVPSLRQRIEDLPELVDVWLRHLGADGVIVTDAAWEWLRERTWRGNLAELELVLGRALLRRKVRNQIDRTDLETPRD
ncbi:MAG: sigma 54-interacting transcriptional regulator [Candidatus Eisenbacteria bacterium]